MPIHITKTKSIVVYGILTAVLHVYFVVQFPSFKSDFYRGMAAPGDFAQDYVGVRQLLAGQSVYPVNFMELYKDLFRESPKLITISLINNAHPPFVSIILSPLGFLGFKDAAAVWALLTMVFMLLIIFLLLKSENISLKYFPLVVLFTLAWQPFQSNLGLGQISILITLFVIVGWFFYKKEHEILSGVFIALATMLKFYPGLLIVYFLINKRWKAFLASIISVSIIIVLTLIVTKYDFFYLIFNLLPQDIKNTQVSMFNFSINGFFSKLFLPTFAVMSPYNKEVFTITVNPMLKNLFLYTTIALFLFYTALHIKQYNNDLGFSLFIILSLLLSPLCWDHSLTLLLLSFAILVKELIRRNSKFEIMSFL